MQICGREFTPSEIDWIKDRIASDPALNRMQLSRLFCRHVNWYKPDGGLKEMSCRVAMLRLEKKGLIRLPAPRKKTGVAKAVKRTPAGESADEIILEAGRVDIEIADVDKKTAPLWNELIDRYHYLGYRRMGGAQMRFFVYAGGRLVALLGFSAAAWKVAPRDRYIGWSPEQRKSYLHLVVDNSRFLILPWVRAKNLASRILSCMVKQLPAFWATRYNYRPFLIETFVDTERFAGTCYKAANWTLVGQTAGRGKWDRYNARGKPVKTVWLYPLDRRYKERLCQ